MTDRRKEQASGISPRELALYVMLEVSEKGGYSHIILRDLMGKYQYLEKRDRAFLSRLCEGTLEQQLRMDEVLNRFSSVPVKKMKPVIRNILRLGVYQLLFMDSVPDSAVCNESVKLAVKKGFAPLKGFVNGVLRSIARNKEEALLPFGKEHPDVPDAEFMSIKYSMPAWLVERWLSVYKREQTEQMLKAFLEGRNTQIRCNLSRITPEQLKKRLEAEGVRAEILPCLPYALEISGYDYLEKLSAFREGLFQVQDISSMLCAAAADPKAGDFCLDVCAAPGGKSLHLADLLAVREAEAVQNEASGGFVEARDLTEYKIRLLEENIQRSKRSNIRARQWDATVFDPEMEGAADIVLADLPCSGLGVIGRKKDIKYKITPEALEELAALQRSILAVVSRYVKVGGTLMYSTCTVNRGENEDNMRWFLENFPFEPVSLEAVLPSGLGPETARQGYVQLLPGMHACDGFFFAKFRRMQ